MASEIGAGAPPRLLDLEVYDRVDNVTDSKKLYAHMGADPEPKKLDEDPTFKKTQKTGMTKSARSGGKPGETFKAGILTIHSSR
jgi:hypothetical protein